MKSNLITNIRTNIYQKKLYQIVSKNNYDTNKAVKIIKKCPQALEKLCADVKKSGNYFYDKTVLYPEELVSNVYYTVNKFYKPINLDPIVATRDGLEMFKNDKKLHNLYLSIKS